MKGQAVLGYALGLLLNFQSKPYLRYTVSHTQKGREGKEKRDQTHAYYLLAKTNEYNKY